MSSAVLMRTSVAPEVVAVNDLKGFRTLEREWNDLVTAHNDSLFLRHEFLRVWLECFNPPGELQVLTGRSADGRLVAALPLMRQSGVIRGIPVRQWTATANEHSCRFDIVAEDPAWAGRAFFRHLAAQDDWDVVRIPDVPEGGQAWHLYRSAASEGFPVGAWESQRSPYLVLPRSLDGMQGRVSSQVRSTARRRLRQMEKKGVVRIERPAPGELDAALKDFFRLERMSWKGREGTSCDQDHQTRAFYTRLARVAGALDWMDLYRLMLDNTVIASHYGLTYGGCYHLPKLAFREDYSELSPGLVLMHEVICDNILRKTESIDFLGSDDEWKVRWSRAVRPHYWLYIFRDNFKGRLLRRMKFSWGPRMKQFLNELGISNDDA